jgi:hypothetical protein
MVFCSLVFFSRILAPLWWLFGIVEVVGFFYFSNLLTKKWATLSLKDFSRKLFITALIIRICWVCFSYFYYNAMTGRPFEFYAGDSLGYHTEASELADRLRDGISFHSYFIRMSGRFSDIGYSLYLAFQYYLTYNSIIIARLLKAFYSAYMCVLIYKLAVRNFGEDTGRISAIFCMLMPNLIYYTGLHLKETEMVFLTVWFIERTDSLLRSKKYNFINICVPLVLAGSLFFFRTVLGAAALFALFTALVFSTTHILGMGKRTLLIVWVIVTIGYFIGGSISNEVEQVWEARKTNQENTTNWRSKRKEGNVFAKYSGVAIFAPMIFVIPFPTVIDSPGQEDIKLLHGGNYLKNIMAFFVYLAFIIILKNKQWRDFLLIEAFMLGYLMIIASSGFAHSERFHQPALPFVLIMSAYGIQHATNKTKKYFIPYLVFVFVAIVVWSWFKLAGRGLI